LAIETASIPLYLLAGYLKGSERSTESGLKYFLYGAAASAVMAYGFSLLYGFTGSTNLYVIADVIGEGGTSIYLVGAVIFLILVGLAFKVAVVPFHFWAPDVYEGAPTPITAYISTASKAAGFILLVRIMLVAFPALSTGWVAVVAALSVVTMSIGNLLAIPQHNIKRLLAYSSIAHAGYALIGLAALSVLGTASLIFYLVAYVVTNLAAFAVVILFSHSTGSDEISDYAGLSRRSPGLAFALLVAMLSLAGMPPLAGFVAKFYVFASAVESQMVWLAFIGVINAIVGLYYYLTVLKVVYLYRSEEEDKAIRIPSSYAIALVTCTVLIVVIGVLSAPWMDWALEITSGFF
jgi:NADH-quinone oxidoreductase subunit N